MKMKRKKRQLSFILCIALTVAMALVTTGCNGKSGADAGANTGAESGAQTDVKAGTEADAERPDAGAEAGNPDAAGTEADAESLNAAGTESSGDGSEADAAQDGPDGAETQVIGTGSTMFNFTVVDPDGNETKFEVHTDKETVGDALEELGLIGGEESEYGLYVKTVNGVTADYDTDGVYWAFYVNGEYGETGVSQTEIVEGGSYAFQVE